MTRNIRSYILINVVFFFCSCTARIDLPTDITKILSEAKANRGELQDVIDHYSKDPKDSLKLRACFFLLRNIEGLKTLDSNSTGKRVYFEQLNSKWDREQKKLDLSAVSITIDSLNSIKKLNQFAITNNYISELETVSSDFLIDNIDKSFYVWRNTPWSRNLNFYDFCEYILPYRCSNTYSADSRSFFLSKYRMLLDSSKKYNNSFDAGNFIIKDIDSWFTEDPSIFVRYPYLRPILFTDLLKGKIGTCIDVNSVRVTALRSIGIPAVLDKIPNWGNSNSAHFWYKIIDPKHDTIKTRITNIDYPKYTQHIITGSSYDLFPIHPGIPSDVNRHFIRTVPKVYRESFSKQPTSLQIVKRKGDSIPAYFSNDRLKDVTNEYVECSDISVNLVSSSMPQQKYAYLCVFNNQEWVPVAWGNAQKGKAKFNDVGRNIVYLPAYYYQGQIIPAGRPFHLTLLGQVKEIVPNKHRETITVYNKYPFRIFVEFWQSAMLGGKFQLANQADLADSVTVHTIQKFPFYQTDVKLSSNKKYRYLIFKFNALSQMWVSEIEFWGKDDQGKEKKLSGKPIGNPGEYPYTVDQIADGNRFSYFSKKEKSPNFIGFDLGPGNEKPITKIRFIPRNDDNAIIPNVNFQLFYWNNGWQLLANKKGEDDKKIHFQNVPKGALFLIKNTEGGTENRIFTYKDGKQIFW